MLKKIKDLSDLIKIDNQLDIQKKDFNSIVFEVMDIVKKESDITLEEKDFIINKNVLKIKLSSNVRFIILLHLNNINKKIKDLNSGFILEV